MGAPSPIITKNAAKTYRDASASERMIQPLKNITRNRNSNPHPMVSSRYQRVNGAPGLFLYFSSNHCDRAVIH